MSQQTDHANTSTPDQQFKQFDFHPEKFEELFVTLAVGQQDHTMPDFTKINKAMYLVDFAHFREHGEPITGADYLHYTEGPVPQQITRFLHKLLSQGDIAPRYKHHVLSDFFHPYIPSRIPNQTLFTLKQRRLIQLALDLMRHRTPAEATGLFNQDPGWTSTTTGQRIPYETASANSHQCPSFHTQTGVLQILNKYTNPHLHAQKTNADKLVPPYATTPVDP